MIRAILTDIEGTTSSLSFVKDVLFPYARRRLADFVRAQRNAPEVRELLDEVRRIVGRDLSLDEVIAQLEAWSDRDEKAPPLKALQGMIWEAGYRRGDFQGHVYEDAAAKLREWKERGLDLYVFSSGSVPAQKLLFGHTPYGDLTLLFSGYFDTRTGPKRNSESYRKIAAAIGLPPAEILFLSDVPEELDAAREAGMETVQLVRDGAPDEGARHRQVRDFNEIAV
ncbi:enolase-phosphatase E1 [Methylomarinovum caldicuralii]|uniref:Enolase-phosphatase E1 n=1 Tax=Methylomarinovum caldicuralii TaxID=438856 RepID=A0AAU9CHH3_9GAMM|nr:acireductone synthase [Methylomarinovum caldicuralii]BCX82445.1 enolase-phosphatase E1 [Methylomarinovum caldicuralii]